MYFSDSSEYYAFCAEVLEYVEKNGRAFSNKAAITRAMSRLFWKGCRSLDDVLSLGPSELVRIGGIGTKTVFILTGVYPDQPHDTIDERDRDIRRHRTGGWTVDELSKAYGLSEDRIKLICREAEMLEQMREYASAYVADVVRKERIKAERDASA